MNGKGRPSQREDKSKGGQVKGRTNQREDKSTVALWLTQVFLANEACPFCKIRVDSQRVRNEDDACDVDLEYDQNAL